MIKAGSLPAAGPVTLGAVLAKLPVVPVVYLVAGVAILRRSRVLTSCVALRAGNLPVLPGERICRSIVIKGHAQPARGRVALRAGLTELPAVRVVILVAGVTVLGNSRVLVALMAFYAGSIRVPACKRVRVHVMVKSDGCPASGRVTLRAGLTQLSVVCVLGLVAGVAVLWRPAILVFNVAIHAGCLFVLSPQRVRRGTVGERGTLPAVGRMAFCTVPA